MRGKPIDLAAVRKARKALIGARQTLDATSHRHTGDSQGFCPKDDDDMATRKRNTPGNGPRSVDTLVGVRLDKEMLAAIGTFAETGFDIPLTQSMAFRVLLQRGLTASGIATKATIAAIEDEISDLTEEGEGEG